LHTAGKEIKEIPFLVVINKEGEFQRIEDRRIDKKRAQSFCVIKGSRTSAIVPYLFWDNVEYILNYTKDQETKNEGENEESKRNGNKCKKITAKKRCGPKKVQKKYQKNTQMMRNSEL
jgi:CRISPR-associated protein Csd1